MKPIVIMGNGPSMKKEYLDIIKDKKIDAIGMNAIYRLLKQGSWFPKYYVCFDSSVTGSHHEEFLDLIKDQSNGIYKFCFYKNNFKDLPENPRVILKDIPPQFSKQKYQYVTTGTCSARFAIEMGYDVLILVGIDCNYKEKVAERVTLPNTRATFRLTETPVNNPNYFFEDYQVKGDVYNIPNAPYHRNAWLELSKHLKSYNVKVIQTSHIFQVNGFERQTFEEAIEKYFKITL